LILVLFIFSSVASAQSERSVPASQRFDLNRERRSSNQSNGAGTQISRNQKSRALNTPVIGFADLHTHQFANYAFGGKAFVGEAFGPIERALPHCDTVPGQPFNLVHGPGGTRDLLGQVLRGSLTPGHRVGGFPEFDGWPRWDNTYTHQSMYEDWVFRAYQGGMRLMVMLAVNNEFACSLIEKAPGRTCNDMEAVDLQIEAAKEMESDIDRRSGGPGSGWYRIVTSPEQARAVINKGKLAVVLGIEVDSLFNCKTGANCTPDRVIQELDRYYELGVRHFFPIHFNSNEFGGAALYQPLTTAAAVSQIPGSLPLVRDCYDEGYRYQHPRYPLSHRGFPARATCNAQGLTGLGKFLIREMKRKKVIIDIDHMSALAKNDTMTIAEEYGYPVVSGHTGFFDISKGENLHEANLKKEEVDRIRELGGMVAFIPHLGGLDKIKTYPDGPAVIEHRCGNTSETVAQAYLYIAQQMKGGSVGFGTDFNGLAGLPGPRFGPEGCPGGGDRPPVSAMLRYPFAVVGMSGTLPRSVIGNKTFDFNTDGLAHVGMLPDLIADLSNQFGPRGPEILNPLLRSAEGYIKVWERAEARSFGTYVIPYSQCLSCGDGTPGNPYEDLLRAILAARDGEYIYLSPGSYPGDITITKNVTLAKWPGRAGTVQIGR
jgi:microsomal dipeptidase-like Zn-dependent dipeptidase